MAIATKAKALTKPGTGEADGSVEVVGTQKGFLTAWQRSGGGFETELLVQRFDANGKAIGREITVKAPTFGISGPHDLVALGGNKVGLLYTEMAQLKSVVIDTVTGKVSKPVTVVSGQHSSLINDLTILPNGKVALVTRDFVDFSREDTTLILLDKTMKPIGSPKVVEQDGLNPLGIGSYQQTIVENGKGGLVLYLDRENEVEARAFSASGKLSKAFDLSTTEMRPLSYVSGIVDFEVRAEALETGGVAVAWMALDPGQDLHFDIYARVIGENNKPVGKDFKVNIDAIGHQDAPEILTFDKGFGVAWTDQSPIYGYSQVVRFFDKNGKPVSDEITTEYFGSYGDGIFVPSLDTQYAQLPDGSYVKTFGANGAIYSDGIPAPTFGNSSGQTLSGNSKAEILLGAGGNDTLKGSGGSDALDGGTGNDKIDGGTGDDLLVGADGNDSLKGGGGADVFVFRPGAGSDTIRDFGGKDRIDVSAFHLTTGEVALTLGRQDGDDVVFRFANPDKTGAAFNEVRLVDVTLASLGAEDFIL